MFLIWFLLLRLRLLYVSVLSAWNSYLIGLNVKFKYCYVGFGFGCWWLQTLMPNSEICITI